MTTPRRWTRAQLYVALNVHRGMDAHQFWSVLHPSSWLLALDDLLVANGTLSVKQAAEYQRYTASLKGSLAALGLPFEPPVETAPYDPLLQGMRAA